MREIGKIKKKHTDSQKSDVVEEGCVNPFDKKWTKTNNKN